MQLWRDSEHIQAAPTCSVPRHACCATGVSLGGDPLPAITESAGKQAPAAEARPGVAGSGARGLLQCGGRRSGRHPHILVAPACAVPHPGRRAVGGAPGLRGQI